MILFKMYISTRLLTLPENPSPLQKKNNQTKPNKQKPKETKGEWGFYDSHLEQRKLELNSHAWTGQELKYQPPVYSRQLHRALNPGVEEVFFCISKKFSK